MAIFQIREVDKHGCGSFHYFDTDSSDLKEIKQLAEKTMNDVLYQRSQHTPSFFPGRKKPKSSVKVVEYNKKTHLAKRGGIKFTLGYEFVEMSFVGGGSRRTECYVA